MSDTKSGKRQPGRQLMATEAGNALVPIPGSRVPVLGDANELVPKLLRLEDGYWEQLGEIAAELSALRHERVGVNGLIREVLIEGLELRPPPEIQVRRVAARKEYETRVEAIEGKIAAGQASDLSVRDRMFYEALMPAGGLGAKRSKGGRPKSRGKTAEPLD